MRFKFKLKMIYVIFVENMLIHMILIKQILFNIHDLLIHDLINVNICQHYSFIIMAD